MHNLEDFHRIMSDGFADVDCTDGCGETGRVEPDGDYPCPNEECAGRLVSPLILEGLI